MSELYSLLENEIMEFDVIKLYFQNQKLYVTDEQNEIVNIIENDNEDTNEFITKVKKIMTEIKKDTITIYKESLVHYYEYVEEIFQKPKRYQVDYDYYFPPVEIIENKIINKSNIQAVLMNYETNYILLKLIDKFKFYRKEEKNDVWTVYWYYYFTNDYIIIWQREDHYITDYKLFFVNP